MQDSIRPGICHGWGFRVVGCWSLEIRVRSGARLEVVSRVGFGARGLIFLELRVVAASTGKASELKVHSGSSYEAQPPQLFLQQLLHIILSEIHLQAELSSQRRSHGRNILAGPVPKSATESQSKLP